MIDEPRKSWEQRENESNEAYARFLIYRNLGVARSLNQAHAIATKGKKRQASGQWTNDSTQFDWVNRASAWDIDNLELSGRNAVVAFVNALEKLAEKSLAALNDDKIKPKDWKQTLEAVNILGSFIPAETVEAIRAYSAEHRISPIGANPASGERTDKAI